MTIRLYVPAALAEGAELALPPPAARHAQVRRAQPGDVLQLFDGSGCDWPATVLAMGRSEVRVRLGTSQPVSRELPRAVTLALGMPANERMDLLVEKATELGVGSIQPLLAERSVLRLAGERAERKRAHWQAIAESACEQCGRARVPRVEPVRALDAWLPEVPGGTRIVLSLAAQAQDLSACAAGTGALVVLSGPEGGLAPEEEAAARHHGFLPASLGPRVLRADTAPLALLAWFGVQAGTQTRG